MDDRGHVVSAMGLGAPDFQDGVLRVERVCELQQRKQVLQAALSSRLGELRRVCLLESELTGKLPRDFPLESGERPPFIQRRAHTHTQDDSCQRRQMKTLFGGALRRTVEADKNTLQGKRTVHRGCHTEETLKSESSSMSDSTSQDNESSPSVAPEQRSLSHPRLNPSSPDAYTHTHTPDAYTHTHTPDAYTHTHTPDAYTHAHTPDAYTHAHTPDAYTHAHTPDAYTHAHTPDAYTHAHTPDARLSRKLSPVDIYYEMRTRRNSTSSSVSPSHSLPRSASNVEGRSVPATPLLSRTAPISIHVRPDVCGGIALKQWCGSPDVPHFVPLASLEGSASERRNCPYGSRGRRSNSSEALLDRSGLPDARLPPRGAAGPYKSSETLTDGKLRQYRGSPERQAGGGGGRTRASVGGRPSGGGYNEILLDYIWGKAPQPQAPRVGQMSAGPGPTPRWPEGCPPHFNGLSLSQQQLSAAPPPYSPLLLRTAPPTHTPAAAADPRRSKVTRTKSCGPFLAEPHLLSAYEPPLPAPLGRRPPPTPEDATRSLHKALALEGLRDWYLRNALGYAPSKGHAHTPPQATPTQGEGLYPPLTIGTHMSQSASFHGYPLQARAVELSRFPEPFPSQLQDGALADPPADPPAPGTLV